MNPLRALLVDDEPLASRRLAAALRDVEGVEVIGTTTSAARAVEMIARMQPDLVFLDIEMPGLDGFQLIARLADAPRPAIIFVTAYDAHAVAAFGVDAVDYLLKPVLPDRLQAAVVRARHWMRVQAVASAGETEAGAGSEAGNDSFWVHRHQEFARVPIDQIVWLEAERDYVRIHAGNGGGLLRITLAALEARLDPAVFVRVHRSAICRRAAVTGLRRKPTGALELSLDNGDWVPVGRSYGSGLRALLRRMRGSAA